MTSLPKNYSWNISLIAGMTLLALAFALPLALADEPSRFTGTWQRNEDESDDPQETMQAAMEAMREQMGGGRGGMGGRGGGGRPGGMGGRSGGGGRGGEGGRGERQPGQGGFGSLSQMTERIETILEDNEFHVVPSGEGRVRIFYLDGKKHAQDAPNGAKMETRAEMKGDRIVVESKTEQGAKITTTYSMGPDGARMIVTVKLEGRRTKEPIVIRTVYDSTSDEPAS